MLRRLLTSAPAMVVTAVIVLATALVTPAAVQGQPAPRRLSLAELVTAVGQHNLQLRAAAFEVAIAEAQLAQARGGRSPQVTLTGSYSTGQQRPGTLVTIPNPPGPDITFTVPGPDPDQVLLRVGIQYPLYTGGRVEAQIALAEANVRGAQAVLARVTQQVVFSIQQAYLQALLARERVAASRQTLEQAEESLRVARARVQAGVAPGFDELQAEVAVARALQEVVQTRSGARNADASLNALLNQRLDAPLDLTDTLDPRPVPGTLAAATERALRQRPEIAELQARIEATRASIALAASGGQPTVVAGVGYDVSGTPSVNSGAWSATLSLTLSLFDGGITRARIREAELRLQQLRVQELQTRQGIELEVLSAQATLAQIEVGMASVRFVQNIARIRLLLAVGGAL